jgi:hypothetical protein
MTEAEWLACTDPSPMLDFLRDKASDRKFRLFALACCCRILRLLTDQRSVNVILARDRYLDGTASPEQLTEAGIAAQRAYENAFQPHEHAASAAVSLAIDNPYQAAVVVAASTAYAVGDELAAGGSSQAEVHEKFAAGQVSEKEGQAALLRCIFGNPFRSYPAPDSWPATVVQLANALYNGKDCGFALHDALLEAGHPELADHFRQEQHHPKGCWALDLVLGKA